MSFKRKHTTGMNNDLQTIIDLQILLVVTKCFESLKTYDKAQMILNFTVQSHPVVNVEGL